MQKLLIAEETTAAYLQNKLTTLAFQTHMASDKHPSHPILEDSESRRKKKQQPEGEKAGWFLLSINCLKMKKKRWGMGNRKNHIIWFLSFEKQKTRSTEYLPLN